MFTEPQTVTVNAVAKSLPRTAIGNLEGAFQSRADGLKLRISHVEGKRNRRTVRLDSTKTAADPLLDGVSKQYSMSAIFTVDSPLVGYSDTEVMQIMQALIDWLDVPANLTKVVGGES